MSFCGTKGPRTPDNLPTTEEALTGAFSAEKSGSAEAATDSTKVAAGSPLALPTGPHPMSESLQAAAGSPQAATESPPAALGSSQAAPG